MATTHVQVERFSLVSPKPFAEILAEIDAAIGHPDMREFEKSMAAAESWHDVEQVVGAAVGRSGLMQFLRLDFGMILQKAQSSPAPRILRIILGNPLIIREMAKHVPDAASYGPVTILIDERADGVHLSYDFMASYLAPYGNLAALEVARSLDAKVKHLLQVAAG